MERDISCVNSFSVQMLPDVPESPVYWAEFDPRAEAAHRGIISQMVVDFQPLSQVQNEGFLNLMDKRLTMPELKIHTPWWYQDKIQMVSGLGNFDHKNVLNVLFSRPPTMEESRLPRS